MTLAGQKKSLVNYLYWWNISYFWVSVNNYFDAIELAFLDACNCFIYYYSLGDKVENFTCHAFHLSGLDQTKFVMLVWHVHTTEGCWEFYFIFFNLAEFI